MECSIAGPCAKETNPLDSNICINPSTDWLSSSTFFKRENNNDLQRDAILHHHGFKKGCYDVLTNMVMILMDSFMLIMKVFV